MITLDPTLEAHEAELLGAVSAEQLIELTVQVAAEVRLSGSPEELRALRLAESQLAAWGFRTRLLAHDGYISLPGAARLEVAGLGELECITHSFAVSTSPSGLVAELIDVGSGTEADW